MILETNHDHSIFVCKVVSDFVNFNVDDSESVCVCVCPAQAIPQKLLQS